MFICSLQAKSQDRTWLKNQTSGELDDNRYRTYRYRSYLKLGILPLNMNGSGTVDRSDSIRVKSASREAGFSELFACSMLVKLHI